MTKPTAFGGPQGNRPAPLIVDPDATSARTQPQAGRLRNGGLASTTTVATSTRQQAQLAAFQADSLVRERSQT
jgi:hypothetical protein